MALKNKRQRGEVAMELIAIAFCCLCGIVIILLAGLFILWHRHYRQPYSAEKKAQAETAAQTYLAQAVPTLQAWTPSCLPDLSCQWRSAESGHLGWRNAGQVVSIGDPTGPGLLAFYVHLKGKWGFLRLCPSEGEVRLDIEATDRLSSVGVSKGKLTVTGEIKITVGQQPLGSIRLPDGVILNSAGQSIGCYHRYQGRRGFSEGIPRQSRYGPVELHSRTVAELNDVLIPGRPLFDTDPAHRPLIRNLASSPSQEEENWLLALIGLELYYDAIRHRSRLRV
jgi:hypothetical protein